MKIVQIFKTDVRDRLVARHIVLFLQQTYTHCRINFDLDDCDRILRVESQQGKIEETEIQLLIAKYGHYCEPLQD
ncbi:MAG: hypothetical protein J0H74_28540 [Chitinophagaceae bacterium]|nr:hypothetical protein [Chitinophagaceae bacterium]